MRPDCCGRWKSLLSNFKSPLASSYGKRYYEPWSRAKYEYLYKARLDAGPEVERPRSYWPNWNYEAELFAFAKRIGEEIHKDDLRVAFVDRSYVESISENEDVSNAVLQDNKRFVDEGVSIASQYMSSFLRLHYPNLPEEGIKSVVAFLTGVEIVNHIGKNFGIRDLVLAKDFPVSDNIIGKVFLAIIGVLAEHQGLERAQKFVHDFMLTQLAGRELANLWELDNPMGVLKAVIQHQNGHADVESRLLWETGRATVMACYMVGVYSDKKLIGKSFGESVEIAENLAAREALNELFGIGPNRPPLFDGRNSFSTLEREVEPNRSLSDYGV